MSSIKPFSHAKFRVHRIGQHVDTPLWCVYGSKAFPHMICCRIIKNTYYRRHFIWGYSVWRGRPGFRTLGQSFLEFRRKNPHALFFAVQQNALNYLAELTTPRER